MDHPTTTTTPDEEVSIRSSSSSFAAEAAAEATVQDPSTSISSAESVVDTAPTSLAAALPRRHYKKDSRFTNDLYTLTYNENESLDSHAPSASVFHMVGGGVGETSDADQQQVEREVCMCVCVRVCS